MATVAKKSFRLKEGTIPQRLLLMNGELVKKKTEENLIANAPRRLRPWPRPDEKAVEIAYLACLTRRPTPPESRHFLAALASARGAERRQAMEDIYWALVNSTEFSWNH